MTKARKITATLLIMIMAFTVMQIPVFADADPTDDPSATGDQTTVTEDQGGSGDQEGQSETGSSEPSSETEEPTTGTTEEPTSAVTTNPTTTSFTSVVPKVKVKVKGPGLQVTWDLIQSADSYVVYRSYKAKTIGTKLATVKGKTVYTDNAVASGKKAYYTVRAHSAKGYSKYSAQAANKIFRVYVETGHGTDSKGRWDSGCTWGKYQEAKLMIPICKSATKYLRAKGVYVYTDAYNGNNKNLTWLMKHLKGYNVSVLINIHCDYKGAPKGTVALYRYSEQKKLAKCLNTAVHKNVKIKDRGLNKRKNLETLNKTKSYCVACLYETGNIKKDNKVLRKKYDAYGKGLAMGVCNYLGVKW